METTQPKIEDIIPEQLIVSRYAPRQTLRDLKVIVKRYKKRIDLLMNNPERIFGFRLSKEELLNKSREEITKCNNALIKIQNRNVIVANMSDPRLQLPKKKQRQLGLITPLCPACKSNDISFKLTRIGEGDLPDSTFDECNNCEHRFNIR